MRICTSENGWGSLILRLFLGAVFFPHGAQKVLGWFGGEGLNATITSFTTNHMPLVLAWLVIAAEFLGSLGLIFGFLTRFSAFGIGCVMTGAILLVHQKNGFFMNWSGKQAGEGFEFHLLAIGMCLALIIMGGGKWSIDRLFCRPKED